MAHHHPPRSLSAAARGCAAAATLIAMAAIACSPARSRTSGAATSAACDPLAPPSTTLGSVLAVGRDGSGTYYTVDQGPGATNFGRVFVSRGTTLERQHVAGVGSSGGAPDADYTFSFEAPLGDAKNRTALVVQMRGGTITGMALGPGDSRSFFGEADAGQTPLTVVDPKVLANFSIQDLPNVVQYVADVSNGDAVVITSPVDLTDSADFRLFYGAPSQMAEHPITAYNLTRSGFGDIAFSVGSATYTLHLTIVTGADAGLLGRLGPGSLDTGTGTFTATFRSPPPTTLTGFSFTCAAGG